MSLSDREYMRVGSEQAVEPAENSGKDKATRKVLGNKLSASEQVGLVIAGAAVVALFVFAIL